MSKDDRELAASLTKNVGGGQSYLDQICMNNKRLTDIKRRVELSLEGNLTDPQACYHRDVTFLLRQLEAGD